VPLNFLPPQMINFMMLLRNMNLLRIYEKILYLTIYLTIQEI
jgi:hypothetical protein